MGRSFVATPIIFCPFFVEFSLTKSLGLGLSVSSKTVRLTTNLLGEFFIQLVYVLKIPRFGDGQTQEHSIYNKCCNLDYNGGG